MGMEVEDTRMTSQVPILSISNPIGIVWRWILMMTMTMMTKR